MKDRFQSVSVGAVTTRATICITSHNNAQIDQVGVEQVPPCQPTFDVLLHRDPSTGGGNGGGGGTTSS
ncbi:MAG: hypothetical protein AAF702_03545 [Chloroflexota bacterium]